MHTGLRGKHPFFIRLWHQDNCYANGWICKCKVHSNPYSAHVYWTSSEMPVTVRLAFQTCHDKVQSAGQQAHVFYFAGRTCCYLQRCLKGVPFHRWRSRYKTIVTVGKAPKIGNDIDMPQSLRCKSEVLRRKLQEILEQLLEVSFHSNTYLHISRFCETFESKVNITYQ